MKGSTNGKSPAINWFFNDWAGGTAIFSRHQKGCYMDLLHAQFNNGHLSTDEIRNILGNDFAAWGVLQKKFAKDAEGKYFNVRLEDEINKRVTYSTSQSKKRSGKSHDKLEGYGYGIGNEKENEKGEGGAEETYRSFAHLSISTIEVSKLLDNGSTQEQIDQILEAIENYRGNTKYKSLYLTARTWLAKDQAKGDTKPPSRIEKASRDILNSEQGLKKYFDGASQSR